MTRPWDQHGTHPVWPGETDRSLANDWRQAAAVSGGGRVRPVWLALLLALGAIASATAGPITTLSPPTEPAAPRLETPARARFLALGDLPYVAEEAPQLAWLLDLAARGGAPFVLHVGDIKSGIASCTETAYSAVAGLFRAATTPVVFTPGDNEWVDCRRMLAGDYNPVERLGLLRRVMFADPAVLRRDQLRPVIPDLAFPENVYFVADRLLVAVVHVVGSQNDYRPDDPAALVEFRARSAANRRLLTQATAAANVLSAEAMIVVFHANPRFDWPPSAGFAPLFADLDRVLTGFDGPVLAVHGDTHHFRLDQPWRERTDERLRRLWRLEVPGSPLPGGVWVAVEPADPLPFRTEVIYPSPPLDADASPPGE